MLKIETLISMACSCALCCLVTAGLLCAESQTARPAAFIPDQDFNQQDIRVLPPALLREIREKESYWGEVLLTHRSQYESYYRDVLGPGVCSTWDVYKKELDLMAAPSYQELHAPVVKKKSIRRFPDRVWIGASYFPRLRDKKIEGLRVLCFRFGRVHAVPFDIDEGTEDGTKIFTHGPKNNRHLADGNFNHTDQLVFLSHDTGDRIDMGYIANRYGKDVVPVEIELIDPKTRGRGWLYLVFFPANPPPRSDFDYITFLNETVNQQFTDYIWHQSTFLFRGDRVYRKIFCRGWKYAPFFGSTGEDFCDRLKTRINARLCFGVVHIKFDEDDVIGNWEAWNDGQVLATGRGWMAISLPLGLKSPRLTFDVVASETVLSVPFDIHVPFNPGNVLTDFTMKIGTDWHMGDHRAGDDYGYRFFNSNNRDGVVVDGAMSGREKDWNPARDEWRVVCGPAGTVGFRSFWDTHYMRQAEIRVTYTDDATQPDPPEFVSGQVGMHYSVSHVKSLMAGDYTLLLDWYGPPGFWSPDPNKLDWRLFQHYLDILDYPVEFQIDDRSGTNWTPGLRYPVN